MDMNSICSLRISRKQQKLKKGYTTPIKEKARRERAIKKTEEKITLLEEKLAGICTELSLEENLVDYMKLSELQKEQEEIEIKLDAAMNEWEKLCEEQSVDNI